MASTLSRIHRPSNFLTGWASHWSLKAGALPRPVILTTLSPHVSELDFCSEFDIQIDRRWFCNRGFCDFCFEFSNEIADDGPFETGEPDIGHHGFQCNEQLLLRRFFFLVEFGKDTGDLGVYFRAEVGVILLGFDFLVQGIEEGFACQAAGLGVRAMMAPVVVCRDGGKDERQFFLVLCLERFRPVVFVNRVEIVLAVFCGMPAEDGQSAAERAFLFPCGGIALFEDEGADFVGEAHLALSEDTTDPDGIAVVFLLGMDEQGIGPGEASCFPDGVPCVFCSHGVQELFGFLGDMQGTECGQTFCRWCRIDGIARHRFRFILDFFLDLRRGFLLAHFFVLLVLLSRGTDIYFTQVVLFS